MTRSLSFVFLVACTGPATGDDTSAVGDDSADPGTDFGGEGIAMNADCGDVVGLNAQALLEMRTDGHTATLRYVTADAEFVDPTDLTVDITWPAQPEATCYPAWDETPLYAADIRVAIHGLTIDINTADGHYAESLDASAWYVPLQGTPVQASVVGVVAYDDLGGDWVPFPEYSSVGATMDFNVLLNATGTPNGSVAMGTIPLDRMEAGVFGSRFAVATWPHGS